MLVAPILLVVLVQCRVKVVTLLLSQTKLSTICAVPRKSDRASTAPKCQKFVSGMKKLNTYILPAAISLEVFTLERRNYIQ